MSNADRAEAAADLILVALPRPDQRLPFVSKVAAAAAAAVDSDVLGALGGGAAAAAGDVAAWRAWLVSAMSPRATARTLVMGVLGVVGADGDGAAAAGAVAAPAALNIELVQAFQNLSYRDELTAMAAVAQSAHPSKYPFGLNSCLKAITIVRDSGIAFEALAPHQQKQVCVASCAARHEVVSLFDLFFSGAGDLRVLYGGGGREAVGDGEEAAQLRAEAVAGLGMLEQIFKFVILLLTNLNEMPAVEYPAIYAGMFVHEAVLLAHEFERLFTSAERRFAANNFLKFKRVFTAAFGITVTTCESTAAIEAKVKHANLLRVKAVGSAKRGGGEGGNKATTSPYVLASLSSTALSAAPSARHRTTRATVHAVVNGEYVFSLIDTGADGSAIEAAVARAAGLEIRSFSDDDMEVLGAFAEEARPIGVVDLQWRSGDTALCICGVLVFERLSFPMLIGGDALYQHRSVSFERIEHGLRISFGGQPWLRCVGAPRDQVQCGVEELRMCANVYTALQLEPAHACVAESAPFSLPAPHAVRSVPVPKQRPLHSERSALLEAAIAQAPLALHNILRESSSILGNVGAEPGPPAAKGFVHHIQLKPNANFEKAQAKIFKVSEEKRVALEAECVRLEQRGVVTQCVGPAPCVSQVHAVPKHDAHGRRTGEHRFILNVQGPNDLFHTEAWPSTTPYDIALWLAEGKVFVKIDMWKFYEQCVLDEASRRFTRAYFAPQCVRDYVRAPFGLRGMVATAQRFMDGLLDGIENARALIDDVACRGDSIEDLVKTVVRVLRRFVGANATINMAKVEWLVKRLVLAGYVVEHGSVKPDPERMRAWLAVPLPKSRRELRSFLSTLTMFHKHWPFWANEAAPLNKLAAKGVRGAIPWSNEARSAFENLKRRVATETIAHHIARPGAQLYISTDWSEVAVGWVIVQRAESADANIANFDAWNADCNEWEFVSAGSKSMTTPKEREGSQFGEVQALRAALLADGHLLKGHFFYWITDCRVLESLPRNPSINARWQRNVVLELQEYNFEAHWVPREKNPFADLLSKVAPHAQAPPSASAHILAPLLIRKQDAVTRRYLIQFDDDEDEGEWMEAELVRQLAPQALQAYLQRRGAAQRDLSPMARDVPTSTSEGGDEDWAGESQEENEEREEAGVAEAVASAAVSAAASAEASVVANDDCLANEAAAQSSASDLLYSLSNDDPRLHIGNAKAPEEVYWNEKGDAGANQLFEPLEVDDATFKLDEVRVPVSFVPKSLQQYETRLAADGVVEVVVPHLAKFGVRRAVPFIPPGFGKRALLWLVVHLATGHAAATITAARMSLVAFWPTLLRDAREMCAACVVCQRARVFPRVRNFGQARLEFTQARQAEVDLCGPIDGEHIVGFIDVASGLVRLICIANKKSVTIAQALLTNVFAVLGVYQVLHVDEGTEFMGNAVEMLRNYGIGLERGAPRGHTKAARMERAWRTIGEMLSKKQSERDAPLWQLIAECELAYNANVSSNSFPFSPYQLHFAAAPQAPHAVQNELVTSYSHVERQELLEARALWAESVVRRAQHVREARNLKVREALEPMPELVVGDRVWFAAAPSKSKVKRRMDRSGRWEVLELKEGGQEAAIGLNGKVVHERVKVAHLRLAMRPMWEVVKKVEGVSEGMARAWCEEWKLGEKLFTKFKERKRLGEAANENVNIVMI